MSKPRKTILRIMFLAGIIAAPFIAVEAQYIEAEIRIDPRSGAAAVAGKWVSPTPPKRNLSFLPSAPGAPDLGRRISNVILRDASDKTVSHRMFNHAEYLSEAAFASFNYNVDLKPSADPRSAAHASWIGLEEGLIFPEDLLPRALNGDSKTAVVRVELPSGWKLVTTEKMMPTGALNVENVERAVLLIGKNVRQPPSSAPARIALSGQWLFEDSEPGNMAAEVYREYVRVFGGDAGTGSLVILVPMPQPGVQKGTWEAETRGATVVIASSDMAFKTQSLQRLHEQLRHEIFHLWLPNGVNLTGRYDWFYEGFALYQSLRTAVAVNRIRFDDFLDTLSRAHGIDSSQSRRISLIDASRDRWNGTDTQLYARGMVVAFLCDLVLLQGSNGRESVETLLARLYSSHRFPAAGVDANSALLKLFDSEPALAALAADYIREAKPIAWTGIIEAAGMENEPGASRTNLRIKSRLTGRQKALLDKLGYNNWRKLTRK